MNEAAIGRALSVILPRLQGVKLQSAGQGYLARCPAHEDSEPSLSLRSINGRALLNCFAGCEAADIVAALGLELWDLFDNPLAQHEQVETTPKAAGPRDWSPTAEAIWRRSRPIAGSPVETYLQHRHCVLPPADGDLRFLPPSVRYPHPTMLARVTDALTGRPISLHFTRLQADGCGKAGTPMDKMLLAAHRKKGGVIRLWPDEAVTHGLAVAEGIESALAGAHLCTPVWSCIDAGNLAEFPVLAGVQSITVFADNDIPGIRASRVCAQRWADAGCEAQITRPHAPGADLADLAASA